MACTKRRKKNRTKVLVKTWIKTGLLKSSKTPNSCRIKSLKHQKNKKFGGFSPKLFFFLKTRRDSSLLNLLSVLTIPPRRLVQSLPLSGCSHGNHQVSRQAWKARQGTCDSLHMLRQHTLSDNRRLTPSHFFFFLSFFSNLQVHSVVTKRRCLVSLESRQADDQSASPSVCHPVYLPAWHTHTQTHACT